MVYEYIMENYKTGEPIFFSDIRIEGISRSAISQQIRRLCEDKKIIKYDNNTYYIPKESRLTQSIGINADMVARYKYICKNGKIDGFYSGNLFANQIGISTQVPNKVEIVSNNTAAKVRDIVIGKRIFTIRKSIVAIDEHNVRVLQMLDLLKNLDIYLDDNYDSAKEKFEKYIDAHQITKEIVDQYIRKYPISVFKYYYEMRLEDVFAHRR